NRGCDGHGPAKFLATVRDVKGMQALEVAAVFFRLTDHVHRVRTGVDRGRSCNADLGIDVGSAQITVRYRGCTGSRSVSGVQQGNFPKRIRVRAAVAVGIKGVDAVVLCSHKNDVVRALSRDRDVGDVERLRVNLSVDRLREKLAKVGGIDV